MATVKIQMQLNCTVRPDKETGCYVSHCPVLNVYSAGSTELEALSAIKSAITQHVLALYKKKRLGEKLLNAGFLPTTDEAKVLKADQYIHVDDGTQTQNVEVDVPLELVMSSPELALAHA